MKLSEITKAQTFQQQLPATETRLSSIAKLRNAMAAPAAEARYALTDDEREVLGVLLSRLASDVAYTPSDSLAGFIDAVTSRLSLRLPIAAQLVVSFPDSAEA